MVTILDEAEEVGMAIDLLVLVGTVVAVEDLPAVTTSPLDREEPREEDTKIEIDMVAASYDPETTTMDHGRGIMRVTVTMTPEANEGIEATEDRFVGRAFSSSLTPLFFFSRQSLSVACKNFWVSKDNGRRRLFHQSASSWVR